MATVTERGGVKIASAVPTDFHPDGLLGDSDVIHKARHALDAVYSSIGHISKLEGDLQLDKNPMLGAEVHKTAWPVLENTGATVLSTMDAIATAKKTAQAAVDAALTPKDRALASELRTYFRTKEKGLLSELILAARNGDSDLITAALSAPPMLSGLDKTQQEELRAIAALTLAPGPSAIIADCDRATERLTRANEFCTTYARNAKARWLPGSEVAKRLAELMSPIKQPKE